MEKISDNIEPGDVIKSRHGRVIRRVICIDEGDVVVRMPAGGVDAIPLESVRRYWMKVGAAECWHPARA